MTGPSSIPTNAPVAIQPIANPKADSGTIEATSAEAALEKPPATPISARDAVNSTTFGERAIMAAVSPPNKLERTTIDLRPTRSATLPQSGATSAPVSALIEKMRPDHISTAALSCTPSCCTSSGMNGSARKNDPTLIVWIATMIHSVRRQGVSVVTWGSRVPATKAGFL